MKYGEDHEREGLCSLKLGLRNGVEMGVNGVERMGDVVVAELYYT